MYIKNISAKALRYFLEALPFGSLQFLLWVPKKQQFLLRLYKKKNIMLWI